MYERISFLLEYAVVCLVVFLPLGDLIAQCSPLPGQTCEDAPLFCHPGELDGYECFTLPTPNTGGTGDGDPCGDMDPNNISFLNFIATNRQMTMRITPSNCLNPNGGTVGFQVAIYPACMFNTIPTFCKTNCDTNPVNIILNNLSPCYEYTIVIDGCEGTFCNYSIETGYSEPPEVNGVILEGPTTACAGQELCFETDADWGQNGGTFNCYPEFVWTLDGREIARGSERYPCFTFAEEGVFELCVNGVFAGGCAEGDPACQTIRISRLPDRVLPRQVICYEYQPFTWFGIDIDQTGKYTTEQQTRDGCLYTVIGDFVVAKEPGIGFDRDIVCGMTPPHIGPDGNLYPFAGFYALTLSRQNFQGCDSLMDYELVYLDVLFDLDSICRDGGMWIRADELEVVPIDTNVKYRWFDRNTMDFISSNDSILVQDSGTYCLQITMTHLGESCSMTKCVEIPLFRPEIPNLIGDTIVCNANPYQLFASACMDTCAIIWHIPPSIPILSVSGGNITLDLNDQTNSTVLLCASSANDCGESEQQCIEVRVESGPRSEAGPDQIVCGELETVLDAELPAGLMGDWSTPSAGTFSNSSDPKSRFTVPNYGEYVLTWSVNSLECNSTDSLLISFVPPLLATNQIDTCDLDNSGQFLVSALVSGGIKPYTLFQGSGSLDPITGEFVSDLLLSGDMYSFGFRDSFGCEFYLTGSHTCGCFGSAARIESNLSELCEGDCFEFSFDTPGAPDPNDIGGFLIHSDPDPLVGQVFYFSSSPTLCFSDLNGSISLNSTFYVSYLFGNELLNTGRIDLDDPCLKISNTLPLRFIPGPVARVLPISDTCDLRNILLAQSGSGNGRWVYTGGISGVQITSPGQSSSTVSVPQSGSYTFNWIVENGACSDTAEVTIGFFLPPEIEELEVVCSNDLRTYQLNGIVAGLAVPFTIDPASSAGGVISLVNGEWIFTSDPITNNSAYTIIFRDSNGCTTRISGSFECDCGAIQPAVMGRDTLEACLDGFVLATLQQNAVFDPGTDTIKFFLHEGNGQIIVNPLDDNDTGLFTFIPGSMSLNRVYYISLIVGRKNANGTIDLSDPCLRAAPGQPIRFLPIPTPSITAASEQCMPEGILSVSSPDQGSWRQIMGPGNAFIVMPGQKNTSINVSDPGTYQFVFEANNGYCNGSDTVEIEFRDSPRALLTGVTVECDSVAENYRFLFMVNGGDINTIGLNGSDGTGNNFTAFNTGGNVFRTEWIPSGVDLNWQLFDQIGCDTAEFSFDHLCDCLSKAGSWGLSDYDLCITDTLYPDWILATQNLDPNDTLIFYLLDAPLAQGGNRIDSSSYPPAFNFDPSKGMISGREYSVVAFIGNRQVNSVDQSDRCLSISEEITVSFWEEPLVALTFSDTLITCGTPSILVDASGSSSASGAPLSYLWKSSMGTIPPLLRDRDTLRITSAGEYCLEIFDPVSGCLTDTCITIRQDQQLPVIMLGRPDTLTCSIREVILDATGSTQTGGTEISWRKVSGSGNIIGQNNGVQIRVNGPGIFEITLLDENTDCSVTRTVEVIENADPPEFEMLPFTPLRCDQDTVMLGVNLVNSDPGIMYEWQTFGGTIVSDPLRSTIQITASGQYLVIGTDPESGCRDTMSIIVTSENARPDVRMEILPPLCEGQKNGQLFLLPDPEAFEVKLNGVNVDANALANLASGRYDLTIVDASGCILDTVIIVPPGQNWPLTFPSSVRVLFNGQYDLSEYIAGIPVNEIQQIEWFDPNGNRVMMPIVIQTAGEYRFQLTDSNGCLYEGTILISVKQDESIFLPNAFTPNDDGLNDVFRPSFETGNIRVDQFLIFNRWGDLVYSESSGGPISGLRGWDGRFGDTRSEPGVYVYRLDVTLPDNNVLQFSGDVTLIR